jgi:hypothetical protein
LPIMPYITMGIVFWNLSFSADIKLLKKSCYIADKKLFENINPIHFSKN